MPVLYLLPAAMRIAMPEVSPAIYTALSLGIPLYLLVARAYVG